MKNTRAYAYTIYMMISSYFMSIVDMMPQEIENLKIAYICDAINRVTSDIEESCVAFITNQVERAIPWNCYQMQVSTYIISYDSDKVVMDFVVGGRIIEIIVQHGHCQMSVRKYNPTVWSMENVCA